mgnify:CR=1 FL=1
MIKAPPLLDLRNCTRGCVTTRTEISISMTGDNRSFSPWILLGRVLIRPDGERGSGKHVVAGRLNGGATDFEHSSAFAFRIPVIGLSCPDYVDDSVVEFNAWVSPVFEPRWTELRVPSGHYDPFDLPGASICSECDPKHLVVPEGYYAGPPHNSALAEIVAGKRIKIQIGWNTELTDAQ